MDASLKQALAEELDEPVESLTDSTILNDLRNWDSVTALTIMVMLGEAIGVPVTADEMAALKTFGDIAKLVALKLA